LASRSGITAVSSFHRLVDIDQPFRLAEQRGGLHVGRQHLAVAVEDVGPRGRDRVARAAAPRRMAVRRHRVEHERPAMIANTAVKAIIASPMRPRALAWRSALP
jgi:hypothetical protein